MSIAELFESGAKKSQKGHFRNLIMIARADGIVTEEEQKLINKMGRKLGLNEAQMDEVMKNPTKYPIAPPVNKEERFERLIGLVEMLTADDSIDENEVHLIKRYSLGLGFTEESLGNHVEKIVGDLSNGVSKYDILESFLD